MKKLRSEKLRADVSVPSIYFVFVFFCIWVFEGDSVCISGCVLGAWRGFVFSLGGGCMIASPGRFS